MPDKIFDIQVANERPSLTVVVVTGALILEHIFSFQNAWRSVQTDNLVFDLSGVSYMDSAAIGSLVNAQVSCTNKHKKMALAGVPDRVKKILQATRVDALFTFYENKKAAGDGLLGATVTA